MTAMPWRWRCAVCGWHLASNATQHRDALRTYVRRVRRWIEVRDPLRAHDVCLWCELRAADAHQGSR